MAHLLDWKKPEITLDTDPHRLPDQTLLASLGGKIDQHGEPHPQSLLTAQKWLERTGGLSGLARMTYEELLRLPGVGPVRATRLLAAIELGRRLAVPAPSTSQAIHSAADVADWFRCMLQDRRRESLHALLLDGKNRPIKHLALAEGSWNSCPIDPKVVFTACLQHGAPALILVHNHPSGDPTPSRDDLDLTERLIRAGKVIGIHLLDHLIVGREGYLSLADQGIL